MISLDQHSQIVKGIRFGLFTEPTQSGVTVTPHTCTRSDQQQKTGLQIIKEATQVVTRMRSVHALLLPLVPGFTFELTLTLAPTREFGFL